MESSKLFHPWDALKSIELVPQYVVRADGRFKICPLRKLCGNSLTVKDRFIN